MPKQEYETCLYGAEMGPKDAPRICLRGKLDALHAKAVLCATDIAEQMCIRDSIQGDIHEIQEQEGVYTLLLDHVALNGVQTNEQLRVRTKSQTMQYARPGDVFEGYAFSIWTPDMDSVWDRAQRYANHWDKLAWVGETEAKVTQTGFNLRYAPARMRDMVAGRIDARCV